MPSLPRVAVVASLLVAWALPAGGAAPPAADLAVGPATDGALITAAPPDRLSAAEFADPPMWARPQAYWLPAHDQDVPRSIEQIDSFRRLGLGGVTFEPGGIYDSVDIAGPSTPGAGWPYPFLSDAWFAYLQTLLGELQQRDMTMYLLDVPLTMSGSAGGRVAEPARGGDPTLGWTSLVEVVPGAQYESVTRPYWLDPLNPAAVARTIAENYEKHRVAAGAHFGTTLQAMWSDEVGFQPTGSPGTFRGEVPGGVPEVPWSPTFPTYFRALKDYDLTPDLLAHVFAPDPANPESRRVSYDYWDAVSRRFADVYYGGLARWSADHGLGFIGQLLGEETTRGHFGTEGSYYRPAAQPSIASTDLIGGSQDLYGGPVCDGDGCFGVTETLVASAAHLFGRKRVHMESFDLDKGEVKHRPAMLKARIAQGIARGINLFAFHSYDFGGGGYNHNNILFEHQRAWNDYTARLQYLTAPGTTVPEAALGYAPEAFWIGQDFDGDAFARTMAALRTDHIAHDVFPVELLDDAATSVDGGVIRYGDRAYPMLVVPQWHAATLPVLQRAAEFVRSGGTLVLVGTAPAMELRGDDAAFLPLVRSLVGFDPAQPPAAQHSQAYGKGKVVFTPVDLTRPVGDHDATDTERIGDVVRAVAQGPARRARVESAPLLPSGLSAVELLPFRRAGDDWYFLTNYPAWSEKEPGHFGYPVAFPGQPAPVVLDVPATGLPELWDAETGEVRRIWQYEVQGGRLRIPVDMAAFGSAMVRLAPGNPATADHIVATDLTDARIEKGRIVGFARAPKCGGSTTAVVSGRTVTVQHAGSGCTTKTIDPTYDVGFSDGITQQRRTGSWSEIDSTTGATPRTFFLGTGTYAATVDLPTAPAGGRVFLDLGSVGDVADVVINGQPAGRRLWYPYAVDVSDSVRDGNDSLSIAVTVSQAAELGGDPRYPAGLLGPVIVRVEPLVSAAIPHDRRREA